MHLRHTRRPRASILLSLSFSLTLASTTPAFAAGVSPLESTPVQREQAQSRFARAKEKFDKRHYEAALAEFRASLDIVSSPNTRVYIARCHREMGHLVEAYVEFGRAEIEAKELAREDARYGPAARSATEERAKIEPKLAFLNIEVAHAEEGTTLKVANEEVRRGGWSEPIPITPGVVEVTVQTPGRAPVSRTTEAAVGQRVSLTVDAAEGALLEGPRRVEPAPVAETAAPSMTPTQSLLRNSAFVAGGAAIVGLGMFTIFGLMNNGTYSDLEEACNKGPCPPEQDAKVSEGRTQQTMANVGLAVFVLGAGAAVTLWVLSTPKAGPGARATARVDVGPSFVGLRGGF